MRLKGYKLEGLHEFHVKQLDKVLVMTERADGPNVRDGFLCELPRVLVGLIGLVCKTLNSATLDDLDENHEREKSHDYKGELPTGDKGDGDSGDHAPDAAKRESDDVAGKTVHELCICSEPRDKRAGVVCGLVKPFSLHAEHLLVDIMAQAQSEAFADALKKVVLH